MIGKKGLEIISLFSLTVLFVGMVVSCSGGEKSTSTPPSTAGAQASAVSGAVKLSATVGQSTDMASGSIPQSYAPGKGGTIDTSAIANIDPRLKDVVDAMMAQLKKPLISNTLAKTRLSKTSYAPLSAPATTTNCLTSGSYTVSDTSLVSGTTTTHTISVTFSACRDSSTQEEINGTLSGTHAVDSSTSAETANLTANLTTTVYDETMTTVWATFALNGTFDSVNNISSGTNSALGSFTWTVPSVNGDTVMSFNLGSGTPVTDIWTDTNPMGNGTVTHTGNGTFSLNVTAPGQNFSLAVSLTNLEDKITTDGYGNESEWVNGAVSINWTPDLSSLGCKAGTFTIATPAGSPKYIPVSSFCPTSGSMTINDITITFGSTGSVTVSDGSGFVTFDSCFEFENGNMCS